VNKYKKRNNATLNSPFVFLIPFFLLFIVFKVGPIIINFLVTLTKLDIVGSGKFIGLKNYNHLLSDTLFWISLKNTLYYLLLIGPIVIIGGFLLALLVNQRLHGRILARTAIFMPYVIMVTVVGVIWRWILDGQFGLLNYYLGKIGFKPIYWLTNSSTAMIGIVITSVWWSIGYNTVIFLAGLQDIPKEVIESSEIDGAGPFRKLINIIIPMLKPTTFFVVLTTVIYSMQVFGQIYTMTGGGPQYSTLTLVQYLYFVGFRQFKMGYSATIGVVLFLVVIILYYLVLKFFKKEG